jgi:outer membrane receptor for ferric coprogen and ferric-rhodotorulic acid
MKKTLLPFATALSMLFLLLCNSAYAQQKKDITTPKWVNMMDDENVNFFEAQKDFNNFWKNKEKPREEKEVFSNFDKNKQTKVKSSSGVDAVKYSFEYKKFLNWQRLVAPYVQADGSILNTEEQIKLWEQEKKNRDEAEKKNGAGTGNKQ